MIPIFERMCKRLHLAPSGCWEFQGYCNPAGYGRIGKGRREEGVMLAHRVAYEEAYGPIPNGMGVLHKCDNPPCCTAEHLFLGTQDDNMADMTAKGRGPVGEKNGMAKLTREKVAAIRADTRLQHVIAAEYGVHQAHVSQIKLGKRWTDGE